MHDVFILVVKGVGGGALVVTFAAICEGLSPKRFAGLFGAPPAVALAGIMIVLLDKGSHDAHENAVGMLAGCAGMIAYAAAVIPLLRRMPASRAAAAAVLAWTAVAAVVAVPVLAA